MAYQTKTKQTEVSVEDFIEAIEPAQRREDARAICELMARVSGETPTMWGPTIVGFGSYDYRYDSGHQGTMCRIGFSPRKAAHVFYLGGFDGRDELLSQLGKHTTGKSCIYVKRLTDIAAPVLETMVASAWRKGVMIGQVT